ncbi:hypothetical protein [Streptomyces sp. NBC_01500]|uniref:DUF7239 family protein n=1 Tax=Streptomyces sp. NBC_01500 TaxID=2903886 RepID=UPI00225C17C1|nr:hypothetical protein [Streptomyces sp. NBC_01500]MCX4554179.1 hypothetical protein [Streptomyces sp. NBC_01500]MCX4554519.1 hypothetical protein [Streptomyces sp. NBC_01500]
MADPREVRLPKWAQEELRSLRNKLDREAQHNAALRADVGETNVHVKNYISDDQPLPKDARVEFKLGDRYDRYIAVHVTGNRLWLYGGRLLVIHPHVSNAFSVQVED